MSWLDKYMDGGDITDPTDPEKKKKKKVIVFAEAKKDKTKYLLGQKNLPRYLQEINDKYIKEDSLIDVSYEKQLKAGEQSLAYRDSMSTSYLKNKPKYNEYEKKVIQADRDELKYLEDRLEHRQTRDAFAKLFYNNERTNPKMTDKTFITEANNVREWYKTHGDSTDVKVIPTYDNPDDFYNNVKNLEPTDDVLIFGHSGSKLAGVSNEDIADALSKSKAQNCYFGTCFGEDVIPPYKKVLKDKNLHYRPDSPWLGFNPNAETFEEGMWNRNRPKDPYSAIDAEITPLKEGVTNSVLRLQSGGTIKQGWLEKYNK